MTSYWSEWAWLGGDEPTPRVSIETSGDTISSITPGSDPSPGAVRLSGLTLPGFANAHSHAFHRALRGRTHRGGGSFWTWREQMYREAERLDPESYHQLARGVFGEMVQAGFTVVGEFHYLHHGAGGSRYGDANAMGDAVVSAAADVGIRITVLDTLYLWGGLDATGYVEADAVQSRFSDGSADEWAERVSSLKPGSLARIGGAVHSVRAVDPEAMAIAAAWAADRGAPLHAHVSEQPLENEQVMATHGVTPTGVLLASGAITERFTAVHATHMAQRDVTVLGEGHASVCLCPTTERDLADGLGYSMDLAAAGANLCVGSDGHSSIDPFEEMRGVEMHARLSSGHRGNHKPGELLSMGSAEGYRSLGWSEGGHIAVDALADLTVIDLDSTRLVGAGDSDMIPGVVFGATSADVTTVIVGGEVVVDSGSHVALDVTAELRRALGG